MMRFISTVLLLLLFVYVYSIDENLDKKYENGIRDTPVHPVTGPEWAKMVRECVESGRNCHVIEPGASRSHSSSDTTVSAHAGRVQSTSDKPRKSVDRPSGGREVRTVITLWGDEPDRPVDVQSEKLACLDYESAEFCDSEWGFD